MQASAQDALILMRFQNSSPCISELPNFGPRVSASCPLQRQSLGWWRTYQVSFPSGPRQEGLVGLTHVQNGSWEGTPAWCTTWSKPQVRRTCSKSHSSADQAPWGLSSGHFARSLGHSQSPYLGSQWQSQEVWFCWDVLRHLQEKSQGHNGSMTGCQEGPACPKSGMKPKRFLFQAPVTSNFWVVAGGCWTQQAAKCDGLPWSKGTLLKFASCTVGSAPAGRW